MNVRNLFATAAVSAALIVSANADQLVLWDFNGQSAGTTSPASGVLSGTASINLLGGVTATFASGTVNGGSSDPVLTSPPNFAYNTTAYAAQGAENRQRGIQFNVSTSGYLDIVVEFDIRKSNTSSRYVRFQYTTDGSSWLDGPLFDGNAGDTWFNNRTVSFWAAGPGEQVVDPNVNDNANFGFRLVAEFAPSTSGYVASNPSGTYSPNGTLRYDMVEVGGTVVPEPASMIALGTGLLGLAARRRNKK